MDQTVPSVLPYHLVMSRGGEGGIMLGPAFRRVVFPFSLDLIDQPWHPLVGEPYV